MKNLLLTLTTLLLLPIGTWAQTLTTSATASRCQNSGTITVTISGGTPNFTYAITGGPTGTSAPIYPVILTSSSTSETFSSLIPGTYTISVNDANGTYITTTTITGSYTEPRFDLTSENVICGGASDGMLIATNQLHGRNPYSYQIISPAAFVSTIQPSDTFSGLPAGTYQVRMYDSCGNFQTRTATIADNYRSPGLWRGNGDVRISCDSANLFVRPHNGRAPYTVRVIDPINSNNYIDSINVTSAGYYPFGLPIHYPGTSTSTPTNYTFEVTDACGNTRTVNNAFDIASSASTTGNCGGFTFNFGSTQTTNALMGDTLWLTISPDPLGISPMPFQVINGVTISLDSIPYGSYTYSIVTECDTLTGSFSESISPFDSIYTQVDPESCGSNLARLRIEPFGRPDGSYTTQIWRNSTLERTITHGPNGSVAYGINSDSATYTIVMWNQCNDTITKTILIDTSTIVSQYISMNPFCGGGSNIHIGSRIENSTTSGKFYRIHNLAGTELLRILTSSDTGTWTNVAAGTYVVSTLYGGYGQLNASYCESTKDTIEVLPYQFPNVDAVSTQCSNGDLSVEVTEVTGTGPFTYYLRDQATLTTLRGPSLADTFENLSSGTSYNILVVDSCGNSANANISPRVVDTTLAIVGSGVCENTPLTIYTDTFISTTYAWTGPNGFLSTDNNIDFNPVTLSDSGEYVLTANVLNGCVIYRDTFDLKVNPITTADANDLTLATCYSISGMGLFDSAVAVVTSNSPSSIETNSWTILSTPAGGSYMMYDSTVTPLTIKLNSPGDYEAIFSITSNNGCSTDDTVIIRSDCFAFLPVDLISFDAKAKDEVILLNFTTATEKNNKGFEILRSNNNLDWESIGYLDGQGTKSTFTDYDYTDHQPLNGTSYYKLKQFDFDGTFTFSQPIEIHRTKIEKIAVYPNPTNGMIYIDVDNRAKNTVIVQVSDIQGNVLKVIPNLEGKTSIDLSSYRKGIYLVTTTSSTHKQVSRVVKR